jgi:high-affinity iron transporter
MFRVGLLSVLACVACCGAVIAADADHGKTLYGTRCAFCHGASGRGDGPAGAALNPPPTNFTSADFWKNTKPDTIKAAIENGKPRTAMMGFKATLSPQQIDELLAYLQTLRPAQ